MQGKKDYQEKLFAGFQLSQRIPKDNFYRRMKEALNLDFLYKETKAYYGSCGQKSIDPVVFFKLCLVGYVENIISDRRLMEHCSMRMDILYFLNHDIDEPLPWHSTVSRTRQLFPEELFEQVFTQILGMCVDKGMVSGHTQAIDAAPVKANASMESLELKVPEESLDEHLRKVRYMSTPDRKTKQNKASKAQQTKSAGKEELDEVKNRNERWKKDQDQRPGNRSKDAKYTSNKTHYSPSDPDARISVKPGKARKLNYQSQLSVDTDHHVITHIGADLADKKDNQSLQEVVLKTKQRLNGHGLMLTNVLADTGYSSGENYAFLEQHGLVGYIPAHGTYKGGPEGFEYEKEKDRWLCKNGKYVTFRKVKNEKSRTPYGSGIIKKKQYLTKRSDCKGCPFKAECIGKSHEKRIDITYYKEEYDRAIERVNSPNGKRMKAKRQSTVEPVFGTLTQFMGMRKVNTKGLKQANKCMLMAGTAYNIKKYLKYTQKLERTVAKAMVPELSRRMEVTLVHFASLIRLILSPYPTLRS